MYLLLLSVIVFLGLLLSILTLVVLIYLKDDSVVIIDGYSYSSVIQEINNIVSTPKYIIKKSDKNRPHVVMNGHHNIVIPESAVSWSGNMSISNLQDVTDTIDIRTKSRVRIIEYNDNATLYSDVESFDGKIYNYDNVKGTIDLNNYTANIYFTQGLINIDIHTLTLPSEPVLS